MSYKNYTGSIRARIGRGKDSVTAEVETDGILTPGLTGQEALDQMVKQYGADRIMDFLLNDGWVVPVQAKGKQVLKGKGTVDESIEAMKTFVYSVMAPKVKSKKVNLTREEVIANLQKDGIDTSTEQIQKIIDSALNQ